MRRPTLPPLREDYYELDRHFHFVDIEEKSVRRILIELLEAYGFRPLRNDLREDIIRTFLPITVDTKRKIYDFAGNVTCAAAAATHQVVLDLDEFLFFLERDVLNRKEE